MSRRPEIPDGDNYRMYANLSTECAGLIVDLINREYSMRTVGDGRNEITQACSEVYEAIMDDSRSGEQQPAVRVRMELCELVEAPVLAGQHISSMPAVASSEIDSPTTHAFTVEIGTPVDHDALHSTDEFDVHEMYSWQPLVTAVIEKRPLETEIEAMPMDSFEQVVSHIVYSDNGKEPNDMELMRLIYLLQSVLYTARESATYEPLAIPPASVVESIGKLSSRHFGAIDAVSSPCPKCIRADVSCIHNVSSN